jgi:tRNA-specific 2-thiouridylase
LSTQLHAQDCSWVGGRAPALGLRAAKTRYRQQDAACEVLEADSVSCQLQFEQAQWAVTPGQSAVLYEGAVCLGGGVINTCNAPTSV